MSLKQDILDFFQLLFSKKFTVFSLALQDIKRRYVGSFLGFLWAFVQPIVMTVILWLIMGIVFAARDIHGVPFFVWLLTGMVVWSFFVDAINSAASVFREYVFLVKKIQFKYVVLPFIKVLSALAVHIVFIALLIFVLFLKGIKPDAHWVGIIYYLLCSLVFLTGIAWLVASLSVLFPDMPHIINVLLQFGFWLTPVFWSPEMLPPLSFSKLISWLIMLNPISYIIEGYRASLLYQLPIWMNISNIISFWSITLIICFLGLGAFSRFKTQFADLL